MREAEAETVVNYYLMKIIDNEGVSCKTWTTKLKREMRKDMDRNPLRRKWFSCSSKTGNFCFPLTPNPLSSLPYIANPPNPSWH